MRKLFYYMYRLYRMNEYPSQLSIEMTTALIHCHVCGVDYKELVKSKDYEKLCWYFDIEY